MEYVIAMDGIGISGIFQKMTGNPWLIVAIAVVVILLYYVTTRG